MRSGTPNLSDRLKKRFFVITILFVAALAVVVGRLFLIELIDGETYAQITGNRSRSAQTLTAKRGDILDRNNVLLATSTMEYKLILDPVIILDEDHDYLDIMAPILEKCFGIPEADIRSKARGNSSSRYVVLKTGLTYSDVKDFLTMLNAKSAEVKEFLELPEDYEKQTGKKIEVAGAWLEEGYKRNYTYGTFASSVLGFTEDGYGLYGIEKYYNDELSGADGKKYTWLNNDNVIESVYRDADDGNTIQLTLDYNIQSIVQKYMMEMLEESGAKTVAVTIQNPNTGEFYAMEDTGTFDPNNPRDLTVRYSDYEISLMNDYETAQTLNENWKNFCVTETYEPGSTFKAFTVAGALEEGIIGEDQIFFCDGSVDMLDYTIHCANIDGHGYLSLTDALAESCNISMMDIAAAEGVDLFCKYQSQFGFGALTNVDLPTEMSCRSLMFTRENMTDLDLATNSFGQNFNVTMVQMSSAFCSLINGGTYYKPYVVKGIYNSEGELVKSAGKTVVSRPVSEETCRFLKQALRHVVTDGTGPGAAVPGYITAGKTGTAEKGASYEDLWVASFIGFAPYENPQVVCYVVIDEPAVGGDGSSAYACKLFSQIMAEVLPYLNATPASMDYDPTGQGSPEEDAEEAYVYDDTDDSDEADDTGEDDGFGYGQDDGYGYEENDYDYDTGYDYEENYDTGYEENDYNYDSGYQDDWNDYYGGEYDYGGYYDEPGYDDWY